MFVTFAAIVSSDGVLPKSEAIERALRTIEFKNRSEFLDWWSAYGVRLWQAYAAAQTRGEKFITPPGL